MEEYEPRPVSTKTSGEPSTNSPTFEKWNGQIDLNEEEDSTDDGKWRGRVERQK